LHYEPTKPAKNLNELRVAIVHYWFVTLGGGEKVVEQLAEIFPQADLFAIVADPGSLLPSLRNRNLKTSFLQRIPGAKRFHRHFMLLYPLALENLDLRGYDLVISSESGPAKGVLTSVDTCHICYCHSPMRYLWDMYAEYRAGMSPLVKTVYTLASPFLRIWDITTANRVDYFVANSRFVGRRIQKIYRRESEVIHPPVDVANRTAQKEPGEFYLCVGRLVDYKRIDLAIEACKHLSRRLRIVGDGPLYKRLRRLAGPTIEFTGTISQPELEESLARSRALLFPGEEDFGIVPVESQSYGRPVIAYASGGSLETVNGLHPQETFTDDRTGIFFQNQTVPDCLAAISKFESIESGFNPDSIRTHSLRFDTSIFRTRMREFVAACYARHQDIAVAHTSKGRFFFQGTR
jgi:glycosyltransferase involved in cell wall biosynthesis